MRDINSIIERMKQVTRSRSDADLIKYLGIKSSNAVSTWRARKRVPYPECDYISQKENINIGYLLDSKQLDTPIPLKPPTGHTASAQAVAEPEIANYKTGFTIGEVVIAYEKATQETQAAVRRVLQME